MRDQKRIILAVIVMLIVIIIGNIIYLIATQRTNLPATTGSTGNNTLMTNPSNNSDPSTPASLKYALSMSPSGGMRCTRVNENGDIPPGTVYIKDNKIMFEGGNFELMTTNTASGIYKDNSLWIWEGSTKTGTKIDIPETQKQMIMNKIIIGFDKYKQDCSSTVFSDDIFIPPNDVTFDGI